MFSWDHAKAISNQLKHGVSFEEAGTVFLDPEGLDWEDQEHSAVEPRRKRLASSLLGDVLLVVYTLRRKENAKEEIRIITARQASKKERKAYKD